MAYLDFLFGKPDAAVDDGADFGNNTQRNLLALFDAALTGNAPGWEFSVVEGTGTALFPQFWYLKSAGDERWLRAELTWGTSGGEDGGITDIAWSQSDDSGAVWEPIATQAIAFDSFGNPTASTGSGGFVFILLSMLMGRWFRLYDSFVAHIIDGNAHGIEDMAYQLSSDVDIGGGIITANYVRHVYSALGNKNAAFNIDLSTANVFTFTVTGASAAATFINAPPDGVAQPFSMRITNGGIATSLATLFAGVTIYDGAPALSAADVEWVHGIALGTSGSPIIEITGISPV